MSWKVDIGCKAVVSLTSDCFGGRFFLVFFFFAFKWQLILLCSHGVTLLNFNCLLLVKMFGFVTANENKTHTVYLMRTVGCGDSYSVHLNVMHIGVRKYIGLAVCCWLKMSLCGLSNPSAMVLIWSRSVRGRLFQLDVLHSPPEILTHGFKGCFRHQRYKLYEEFTV